MRRDVQETSKDVGSSEEARTGGAGRRWSAAERREERPRDGREKKLVGEEVGEGWLTYIYHLPPSSLSLSSGHNSYLSLYLRFLSLHLLPLIPAEFSKIR
jgi:hypothetical protein